MIEITETLILITLSFGAKHGYLIMGKIASMTNGDYKISAGTLYRTLAKLQDAGMIEEVVLDVREVDQRRRYYQITEQGKRALNDELKRMGRLIHVATSVD